MTRQTKSNKNGWIAIMKAENEENEKGWIFKTDKKNDIWPHKIYQEIKVNQPTRIKIEIKLYDLIQV